MSLINIFSAFVFLSANVMYPNLVAEIKKKCMKNEHFLFQFTLVIFVPDLIRVINDPEHPLTLEELNVVEISNVEVCICKVILRFSCFRIFILIYIIYTQLLLFIFIILIYKTFPRFRTINIMKQFINTYSILGDDYYFVRCEFPNYF